MRRKVAGNRKAKKKNESRCNEVLRIIGANAIKLTRNKSKGGQRGRNADYYAGKALRQSLPQHHPDHGAAARSECHPNTDFTGPPLNRVSHQSVYPKAAQSECNQSEEHGESGNHTLLIQLPADLVRERADAQHRQRGIDFCEHAADLCCNCFGGPAKRSSMTLARCESSDEEADLPAIS